MSVNLQDYWESINATTLFEKPDEQHPIRQLLIKHIPFTTSGQAIEIGCYPGTFLTVCGDLGYTLHGIDTYHDVHSLDATLKQAGYKTGGFYQIPFEKMHITPTYNLVTSFGFLEHFDPFEPILEKHIQLMLPEGYIAIGAPNFGKGLQLLFHYLFDTPNLKRHYIRSMDLKAWTQYLKSQGLNIQFADYCGGFQFWMNNDQHPIQHFLGLQCIRLLKIINKLFKGKLDQLNHPWLSCYFLIIAKKNK